MRSSGVCLSRKICEAITISSIGLSVFHGRAECTVRDREW